MKPRMLLALAMLLVLLMASSVPAAAGGPTVPFKAYYAVSPPILGLEGACVGQQFPGVGDATHLGESTFDSEALCCFDGTQSGTATWTADNGAHLSGGYEGTWFMDQTPDGHPLARFEGNYHIESGDGRFFGYVGTGRYRGTSLMDGTGEGTVTKPEGALVL